MQHLKSWLEQTNHLLNQAGGPTGGGAPQKPPSISQVSTDEEEGKDRSYFVILAMMLLFHIGVMVFLGTKEVPEDLYDDPTEIPERFAKLIVPEQEPEEETTDEAEKPEMEGGEEEVQVAEAEEDEPDEAGDRGGNEEKEESASRSAEEIRDAVRSKGILAVFGAKGQSGALADVLGDGGVADGLDQALGDVGGVVMAQRGMDVRGPRGSGGGKKAGIGDLSAGKGRGMGLGSKNTKKIKAGVSTAKFTSVGSLDADAIRKVVQKGLRGIKFCYEKELTNNPELAGKVIVKFTIGEDGSVTKYEVEETTVKNKDVEGCILKRVRRWKFPKPDKGPVTVSYPFIFTASG